MKMKLKKCPPGVICVENVSMFFIVVCLFILIYVIYKVIPPYTNTTTIHNTLETPVNPMLDMYNPPLRAVPINVATNIGAVDVEYRQVGIMSPVNTKGKVIPLMGRPLFTNRDKWQYYTISNENNAIKLPISKNGKSCTSEYGCDSLSNGDNVLIEGINETYTTTLYDTNNLRYLPYV
jgi:hypothetical protein